MRLGVIKIEPQPLKKTQHRTIDQTEKINKTEEQRAAPKEINRFTEQASADRRSLIQSA